MTDTPRDSLKRTTTIDKAKEARRYDQATEAAIQKIRSLLSGDVAEIDAHPLADIYVQELVRCEAIRQMKEGSFRDAGQLARDLQDLLRKELGPGVTRDLSRLIARWVRTFKAQLGDATDVTRRKNQLELGTDERQRRGYLGTPPDYPAAKSTQGRYKLDAHLRGEGLFALEGTPLYGEFDARRFAEVFGQHFDVGFPIEVNSEHHIFLVDYDGTILSYGLDQSMGSLFEAAESLAHRLDRCFS